MPLTGKFSFRRTLTGKVLLIVEEEVKNLLPWAPKGSTRKRWRDATLFDLTHAEIRHLLEFRDGGRQAASSVPAASTAARPQKEPPMLDGVAWHYPIAEDGGIRRANGH